ncbi:MULTISPECIES: hypothetical protein [unclassified Pseudomonas]|jgi:hypothetical protein|uniref:hypothetical protein n=1 Tax=unclassified Pseudomonas TaxID=196821 RepID=UPI0005B4FEF9|nr:MULTISPECIES: hypothetical protein [unclassified Pseudomonas]MDP9690626.1 hypothetical protein [Pseudomonas mohnii]PMZ91120.1 hypothetical protein C1X61_05960 [Pseudomonas sp. FW215-T2]PNA15822.1 hypothetical protein C1X62_04080 [Pseudomonas sp. FW215-R3]PNB38421.1 hypothetical protein C1X63_07785 [Pseudomonas sp. FW305-131]
MSDNDRLKSRITFKSSEFFTFPETDEHYRATVKLTPSRLIRVTLSDFKASFTTQQVYEIATGLINAVISSFDHNHSKPDKSKVQSAHDHWTALILRHNPFGSHQTSDLLHVVSTGRNFLMEGALLDPEPMVEFGDGEEPIYEFQIRLDGQYVIMSFGWVSWSLRRSEAQWLAEQLWTAVFLATKPKAQINQERAKGVCAI